MCASFNLPGSLWCQVVTWECLIQQKYTIEGSWSHTWKKPWSSLASTCSVSSCIFIGEFTVLAFSWMPYACFWWVRYYYTVGFCINIAELLGIMWISWGCVDFLCHVIESAFHSVWPGVELLRVISYSLAVEAVSMLTTVFAVLSLPWCPAVRSHCLLYTLLYVPPKSFPLLGLLGIRALAAALNNLYPRWADISWR